MQQQVWHTKLQFFYTNAFDSHFLRLTLLTTDIWFT